MEFASWVAAGKEVESARNAIEVGGIQAELLKKFPKSRREIRLRAPRRYEFQFVRRLLQQVILGNDIANRSDRINQNRRKESDAPKVQFCEPSL